MFKSNLFSVILMLDRKTSFFMVSSGDEDSNQFEFEPVPVFRIFCFSTRCTVIALGAKSGPCFIVSVQSFWLLLECVCTCSAGIGACLICWCVLSQAAVPGCGLHKSSRTNPGSQKRLGGHRIEIILHWMLLLLLRDRILPQLAHNLWIYWLQNTLE
jgi:hypothetical protein